MRHRRLLSTVLALALAAVAQVPSVNESGVVNAASEAANQPVSPGSLVFIMGTSLATGLARADSTPLSSTLADVQVSFNDTPAPLYVVSETQITAQVPWSALAGDVDAGTVTLTVRRGEMISEPRQVSLTRFAPGVFAFSSGSILQAIAVNEDGTVAQSPGSIPGIRSTPARPGGRLVIYATGLGAVTPSLDSGALPVDLERRTVAAPVVLIGGVEARLEFSGLSRDGVGVNQINVVVPSGVAAGPAVPLQIRMGEITTSDRVTIAVLN